MVSVQQTNLLPENASQNDTICAQSLIMVHRKHTYTTGFCAGNHSKVCSH